MQQPLAVCSCSKLLKDLKRGVSPSVSAIAAADMLQRLHMCDAGKLEITGACGKDKWIF